MAIIKSRLLSGLLLCGLAASALASDPGLAVPLPGGGSGIGFDDLWFARGLNKVIVPGGRTGRIFLIDPRTHKISSLGGFTAGFTVPLAP